MDKVYGRNPVIETIKSGAEIDKIYVNKELTGTSLRSLIYLARENGITISTTDKNKLDNMSENANHQGVIAVVAQTSYCDVDDILKVAEDKNEAPFIIILDSIEDPHNLGAIIRTANVAGAHGIIIPKRRAVGVNATVYKASAGAVNYTKIAKVSNISAEIKKLKEKNIWIYGAEADGDKYYYEADYNGGIALVIGSEGSGISRLIKENCDFLVKIPVIGEINSLNASVAAGVIMFEALKQRTK